MKRSVFSLLLILMVAVSTVAQQHRKPTAEERARWMQEMRDYKTEYMTKALDLSADQKAKFATIYAEMLKALGDVNAQTRRMEREVEKKGDDASDLDYEKATEALFELKGKEAAIEMQYLAKFKTVLTKKQLFKLKQAERKFTKQLAEHRHEKGKKK